MKRLIYLLMAIMLLVSLAACNSNDADPTNGTTAPTTQTDGSKPNVTAPSDSTEPSGDVTEPDTQPSDPTEGTTAPSEPDVDPSEPEEDPSVPSEPSHEHSYATAVTAPTCTEDGYTTYTCACGDSYVSDQVAAKGHSYTSKVTAPTCTAEGYATFTCACGDSYVGDKVNPKGHSYGAWVTVKEPTTSAAGKAERKCANCSAKEERILDKIIEDHTHSYTPSVTKQPTCTAEGVKTYTCSCGGSYTESIAATGHNYTSKVTKQPTCSAEGVKTYTCSKCNGSYTESIAKLNHSYSATVVKPTCTEQGYTKNVCSRCNDSYKNSYTNAKGHSYSSKVTKAATCTTKGIETYTCASCKHSYTKEIAATGHNYTSKVTKQPTCSADGVKTYTCSKCNGSYTESIAKLNHNYGATVVKPTCTEKGYTKHTCKACSHSYNDTYTNATGHSYTSKVTKAATCSAAGVKTFTCSKCGHSYTESIAKLNHKYTSKVTAPTCTTKGYTTYTCSNCGDSYKGNEVAATGHKNTYTETTPGNCSQNGYVKTICSTCKTVISTTKIPATGNCRFTTTMRMDKAVRALWEKGIYTYNAWGGYTDWNVNVCSGCGDIDLESLRFAYTDRQAAEIMLGYVNDLREDVYGTDKYNLVLDDTLIELAKIRAKEISVKFSHGTGTWHNGTENITAQGESVHANYEAWYNSAGHRGNMLIKRMKYFGYALYADYSYGTMQPPGIYGVQLFWDDVGRDGYWMLQ